MSGFFDQQLKYPPVPGMHRHWQWLPFHAQSQHNWPMTVYEEILDLAKHLSSDERLQLANALLEEELGFGMWRNRDDLGDVTAYVEQMREAGMHTAEGRLKSPEEFLHQNLCK